MIPPRQLVLKNVSIYWGLICLAFSGCIRIASPPADPQDSLTQEVQQINREIQAKSADWVAGVTSMSAMSESEIEQNMGLIEDLDPDQGDFVPDPDIVSDIDQQTRLAVGMPGVRSRASMSAESSEDLVGVGMDEIDWRNFQGRNYVGSVLRQQCGSCVANATSSVVQSLLAIDKDPQQSDVSQWSIPSRRVLLLCGKGSCNGTSFRSFSKAIAAYLVPNEECVPYSYDLKDRSCVQTCTNPNYPLPFAHSSARIRGIYSIGGNKERVLAALRRGPLLAGIAVWQGFVHYKSGVFKHLPDAKRVGGHAVALVGYSESRRAFLLKNSWGTRWGEDGFGWFAWPDDDSDEGWGPSVFEIKLVKPFEIVEPEERSVLEGIAQFKAERSGPLNEPEIIKNYRIKSIFKIEGSSLPAPMTICEQVDTLTCDFNTATLQDGEYVLKVDAFLRPIRSRSDTGGLQKRQLKTQELPFFILNEKPQFKAVWALGKKMSLNHVNKSLRIKAKNLFQNSFKNVPLSGVSLDILDSSKHSILLKPIQTNYVSKRSMVVRWKSLKATPGDYFFKLGVHMQTNRSSASAYSEEVPFRVVHPDIEE